jgi:hypothetical protein
MKAFRERTRVKDNSFLDHTENIRADLEYIASQVNSILEAKISIQNESRTKEESIAQEER